MFWSDPTRAVRATSSTCSASCTNVGFRSRRLSDPLSALARRQGVEEVLWKGSQDRLLSVAIEFMKPNHPDRTFVYEIEIVGGSGGYVNIQEETLTLRAGEKDYQLIVKESGGRWLQNVNSGKLVMVQAERSGMEMAPPNWDGYPLKLVTVQVPQSIFLDKSRGIGYRRVDECESGSPDKATRGSGE